MNELISIVVPVYNVKDYLYVCINSLLNQTYKKLEIILVNDGSPLEERTYPMHTGSKNTTSGISGKKTEVFRMPET